MIISTTSATIYFLRGNQIPPITDITLEIMPSGTNYANFRDNALTVIPAGYFMDVSLTTISLSGNQIMDIANYSFYHVSKRDSH